VFIDDWTATVQSTINGKALMLEATTLYASVNILLYFIIHSDTSGAWGVEKYGAALKDNFVKLYIQATRSPQGIILRDKTRGYIVFPGEKDENEVELINKPPAEHQVSLPSFVSTELVPNEQEQTIIDMYESEQSLRKIAIAVYDAKQPGVYHFDKIKDVLRKYNIEIA